ncbi:unnamed protein product [Allacma fusca]|uniref:Uncharacterized protein n=1 Tax=Allacma fusca TaxID=39272 RepID=A0A8J2JRG2_9HEXA|nr:unnamed protein product [Allacma fusca]
MFNLNRTVLRVVTRLDNAYPYDVEVEISETGCSHKSSYDIKGGFAGQLFLELSRYLNFGYELVEDPTCTYRFDIASNLSIDLFAASFSLTESRGSAVDPSFVTGASNVVVFLNRELEFSMHDFILHPLQPQVWLFIGLLILIFSASIFISTFLNEKVSSWDGIFKIFATSFQQDCNITFDTAPSRIIVWTSSITFLLLLAAYSGKVISLNAVKKYSIDSFEEVVASKYDINFDVGFNNGSAYQIAAEALNRTPVMQRFFQKVLKSSFKFDNFKESLKRVDVKPFAYIIDEETGYSAVEGRLGFFPCEYGKISFAHVKYPWVMFLRKGSKFRPAINYGIQKLRETGHLRYFFKRWIPGSRSVACSTKSREKYSSIQLRHLRSSFIIFAGGVCLALATFLLEFYI